MNVRHLLVIVFSVVALTAMSIASHAANSLPLKVFTMDGIHVASDGSIYAAEGFTGNRIFVVTPDGQVFLLASGLAGPIDIGTDSQGNLFVSNFNDATISKITPSGEITKFADVLPGPAGIVVDSQDNVYVSQYGVGNGDGTTVTKISPAGTVSVFSSGDLLLAPVGTAIDEEDNIYVANFNEGSVIKITPDGEQELLAQIDAPNGFAIGHMAFVNNRLFATSIAGQKIIEIQPDGEVSENASRLEKGRFPNGLTFDAANKTVLFTYGFGTISSIEKIRLRPN